MYAHEPKTGVFPQLTKKSFRFKKGVLSTMSETFNLGETCLVIALRLCLIGLEVGLFVAKGAQK